MNILITSAGRRVSLVKAFQNEIRNYGNNKVFTVDLNPKMSAACQISDGSFQVPRVNKEAYIDQLIELCNTNDINMVVPTIDTELPYLSNSIKKFEENGISLVISDLAFVENCRDKRKTDELFKKLGIKTPQIYSADELEFPMFVKPYDGSNSKEAQIIEEQEELSKDLIHNEGLLFCEFIDHEKNDEYTLDLYYGRDSNLKCVVPRKRIEVRGGETNKGLTVKNKLVPFVKEKMSVLKGARGVITLQLFLNNNGPIKGVEINPRFGGGYPLSYLAGANYPEWLIQEYYFDQTLEYWEEWEENLLMLRYDDEVLVHEFKSQRQTYSNI